MRKLICSALIFAICSLTGCHKHKQDQQASTNTTSSSNSNSTNNAVNPNFTITTNGALSLVDSEIPTHVIVPPPSTDKSLTQRGQDCQVECKKEAIKREQETFENGPLAAHKALQIKLNAELNNLPQFSPAPNKLPDIDVDLPDHIVIPPPTKDK